MIVMSQGLQSPFIYTDPSLEAESDIGDNQIVHDVWEVKYKGQATPSWDTGNREQGTYLTYKCMSTDGILLEEGTTADYLQDMIVELNWVEPSTWGLILKDPMAAFDVSTYTIEVVATYAHSDGRIIAKSDPYTLVVQAPAG